LVYALPGFANFNPADGALGDYVYYGADPVGTILCLESPPEPKTSIFPADPGAPVMNGTSRALDILMDT
jgi:hypothetical protein